MFIKFIVIILFCNLCMMNTSSNFIQLNDHVNEYFTYKTKFKSLKVGNTNISIVNNDAHPENTIITIEASSNRFLDMIYKLRHFSTIIVNTLDFSLKAITEKLQQGDYRDSYNATIDYTNKQIYYYNTKKNPSKKKNDSKILKIIDKVYDPFSLVYHLRNMDLKVGNEYSFTSYSKKKIKDIKLLIADTEFIKTPYVNSMCYIVVPSAKDEKYLLKNKGEMKIWYTVDAPHIPIKIEQKMKHGLMELILFNYAIEE